VIFVEAPGRRCSATSSFGVLGYNLAEVARNAPLLRLFNPASPPNRPAGGRKGVLKPASAKILDTSVIMIGNRIRGCSIRACWRPGDRGPRP